MNRQGACSRRRFLRVVAAHATAALAGGRAMCAALAEGRLHRWQGIAFGTTVSIDLYTPDETLARVTFAECRAEILRLENIFSLYDARSAVGRLNREAVLLDPPTELVELIAIARRYSELTDGAFDISVHPLCELRARRGLAATREELEAARACVDYRAIEADAARVRLGLPGMQLTFNGVAQGYITDRIADLLRGRGFSETLVDLGEKRALGGHPEGRPWSIGVESPADPSRLAGVVPLHGRALATSGAYDVACGGATRDHLVHAVTGGSRHAFSSVSVVASRAVDADALSTCLAVLPEPALIRVLARVEDVEAYVIDPPAGDLRRIHPVNAG